MTTHTLSVLVENKPGVLVRIAGLFSRRGFNIDSLAVGPTEHEEISRMTIVVNCEEHPLEQVTKQLGKGKEALQKEAEKALGGEAGKQATQQAEDVLKKAGGLLPACRLALERSLLTGAAAEEGFCARCRADDMRCKRA